MKTAASASSQFRIATGPRPEQVKLLLVDDDRDNCWRCRRSWSPCSRN